MFLSTNQTHLPGFSSSVFFFWLLNSFPTVFPRLEKPQRLLTASSPMRSQCEMKRGEDGAAVKIHRRR
jgi:hypothetical protein